MRFRWRVIVLTDKKTGEEVFKVPIVAVLLIFWTGVAVVASWLVMR